MAKTERAMEKGLTVKRYFTTPGKHPYDEIEWDVRDAIIPNYKEGGNAFEQRAVEFPSLWSLNATNIVAQKYFRGPLGTPQRESSVRQLIDRVADTITAWGWKDGYFATEDDRQIFNAELKHILVTQKAAFNSPVWFNVGSEEHPQCSACFILAVEDKMSSILNWYVEEGTIFKGGSGSGINLSSIRSSKERLSSGGEASGPVSFMRGADASAGTIKSGGKCFRRGTLVATPGGLRPVEELKIGDPVLTHEGPRAVLDFMPNGVKQCYRVRTLEGYEVEVTTGHKFAYWDAEAGEFRVKPIEEFAPGDALHVLLEPSLGGETIRLHAAERNDSRYATTIEEMDLPEEIDDKFAYVLGLIYGDGELRETIPQRVRVAFAKDPAGYLSAERFVKYGLELFGEEPLPLGDYDGYQVLGYTRKRLVEFLITNGIAKGKGDALGFPAQMFRARPDERAAFLAGLVDADGTYQARGGWSISSIDRDFLVQVQRLMLTLGIPSKLKLSREQKGTWKPLYRLTVVGSTFVRRFTSWIGRHSAKAEHNYVPSDGADKGWGYRPPLVRTLLDRAPSGRLQIERTLGYNETSGYGGMLRLIDHAEPAVSGYAKSLTTTVQVRVESIEPTVEDETYDIEVADVHLLSANGLYASNTRRAAKMVILNVDHPDVEHFVWCKAVEERKARVLRDNGFDMDLDGNDSHSIQYQNANNSVRVTDDFMQSYLNDADWDLKAVKTGETVEQVRSRHLMRQIAQAAWECADPGMQYDTTINDWHTCPASGRINASNPCSEYMHLDNSACNLASLNLMKFLDADLNFDIQAFRHSIDIVFLAQEILVSNSSYPTEKIGKNAEDYRELGLGYANLGALLMSRGVPYDSEAGRAWAGAITALMTGWAYRVSAQVAEKQGPYNGYPPNRDAHLRVMRKHRAAVDDIDPELVPEGLLQAAKGSWDDAIGLGEKHGYRNSQATVLAPTGTIGLMMDCDTTGIEPDLALVKTKKLVGGGTMKIVNQTVPRALSRLGYSAGQVEEITAYIHEHNKVHGAPHVRPEHYPVFDCAMGEHTIHYMGHVKMMAAVQPFISGAISKCVTGETLLTTEDGLIRIASLHQGEAEDSYREHRMLVASLGGEQKATSFYYGGIRPVREVRLRSGQRIVGTPNHRVLVAAEGGLQWRYLDEIASGEYVATRHGADMWASIPASLAAFAPSPLYGGQRRVTIPAEMTEELAFLLGAYASEGHTTRSNWTVTITNADEGVLRRVAEAWMSVFGIEARIDRQPDRCPGVVVSSKTVVEFLEWLGCGARASEKRIPDAILRSPKPMVLAFLQGLWLDAYTATMGRTPKWAICLDSAGLLDDLQAILTNLGVVHSRVEKFNAKYGKSYGEVYAVGDQAMALIRLVPFLEIGKKERAESLLGSSPSQSTADVVPGIGPRELYEMIPRGRSGRNGYGFRAEFSFLCDPRTKRVSRRTLERVAEIPGIELPAWLRTVLDDNLRFSPVESVVDADLRDVYDIAVPSTEAFVANGIVNHNTVNMPESATVEEVEDLFVEGWRLGLKALALYRDNCKVAQPLSADKKKKDVAPGEPVEAPKTLADRKRLPKSRPSRTISFRVGDQEGYMTAGMYPDDGVGEVFLKVSKQGSTVSGVMDALAIAVSIGLQYGVPLEAYVSKFINMRFEPLGMTDDPDIRMAQSLVDYIFRRLAIEFLPEEVRADLGIRTTEERKDEVAGKTTPPPPPATVQISATPVEAAAPSVKAADAPYCYNCGNQMRPAGSCFVCEACGSTSGCS